MAGRKPIEDYYGTEIDVQVVGHSAGFMVDLEREWTVLQGGTRVAKGDFDSLTAEQALDLADRLIEAASEAAPDLPNPNQKGEASR